MRGAPAGGKLTIEPPRDAARCAVQERLSVGHQNSALRLARHRREGARKYGGGCCHWLPAFRRQQVRTRRSRESRWPPGFQENCGERSGKSGERTNFCPAIYSRHRRLARCGRAARSLRKQEVTCAETCEAGRAVRVLRRLLKATRSGGSPAAEERMSSPPGFEFRRSCLESSFQVTRCCDGVSRAIKAAKFVGRQEA